MRSTYSFVDSARPASTSSNELVTPPVRRYCLEVSQERPKQHTLAGTLILEQAHFPLFEIKACSCCVKKRSAPSTIYLKLGLPSESTSAATFETLTVSGLASISHKVHERAEGRLSHRPPQGTKRSALKRKCAPFRKSVPSSTILPAVRKKG